MGCRPRIRTLKPEMWQDENVGCLSRDARILLVGLITMADDEGRLRAPGAAILGHVFPYDGDAPRKLAGWLDEVVASGMVLRYAHKGLPYLAFRHWKRHQQINRARMSELPPPPDSRVVTENAVKTPRPITEKSVKDHGRVTDDAHSHAQACGPGSRSDPVVPPPDKERTIDARAPEPAAGNDPRLATTVALLRQCQRFQFDAELLGVANVLAMYPSGDHEAAARLAVSRGVDPAYRTTDAARALEFAFSDLARRDTPGPGNVRPITRKPRLANAGDLSRFDDL